MTDQWYDRAKRRMRDLRVTQEQLIEALGVSTRGAVGHYLNGRREPDAGQLTALAQRLDVSVNWLLEGDQRRNTEIGPDPGDKVPLISWVQAGAFEPVADPYELGDAEDWVPSPLKNRPGLFCLRVRGASMEPKFRDGELIYVDPYAPADSGKYVVVRLDDEAEATFKQLIVEGGRRYLRALNPQWPQQIVEVDKEATIVGVVVFKGEYM